MCCFTGNVLSVTDTAIFARGAGQGRQYLAYAMHLDAVQEVAMVLPLPVAKDSGDKAVTFIDLSGYPGLFDDLFAMMGYFGSRKGVTADDREPKAAALEVHDVGAFEASFVPTIADFSRLDERFRLAPGVWGKLPTYRDYGFAVFKLRPGKREIHPLAFSFPRADPTALFFPTVHIHDGVVHEQADFDHLLFAQLGDLLGTADWHESAGHANTRIDIKRAAGLVAGDQHVYSQQLRGKLPNQDTLLKLA